MAQASIGTRVARLDGREKALGRAEYLGDLKLPRMTQVRFVKSPVPHARIKSIDTSKAEALPGVAAIVTHKDVPDVRIGEIVMDQRLFAKEKVRYVGDIVAAVAAEDLESAQRAVGLVKVEYEELPAVLSAEEAIKEDAAEIHEEYHSYETIPPAAEPFKMMTGRNVCWKGRIKKGDVEKGFAEADHVLEDDFEIPASQGSPIETHGVVAQPAPGGDGVTVWSSTQAPFGVRELVAHGLHLPLAKVRVIAPTVGGGFGSKCQVWVEPMVAAVALKTGRPVRYVMSREEEFAITQPRHPMKIYVKSGVKNDGTLVARHARVVMNTGHSVMLAPIMVSLVSHVAGAPYKISNLLVETIAAFTNLPSFSLVRGPGGPQGTFAIEAHTDHLADAIGMDRIDFRMKNCVGPGDKGPSGQELGGVGLKEALQKVKESLGWSKERPEGRGVGVAVGWFATLIGMGSSATVKLNEDGTVSVITGFVEHGTGNVYGGLPIYISDELGVDVEKIYISSGDTETGPWDYGTVGSRSTYNHVRAVGAALEEVKGQLRERGARMLEANADEVDLRDGKVFVRSAPEKAIPIGVLCATAGRPGFAGPILGNGSYNGAPWQAGEGVEVALSLQAFGQPGFVAQAAEVEVDRETGHVKVLKIVSAADVGFALNPIGVEGQIEGGSIQSLGMGLTEQMFFDDRGHLQNPSFLDYKVPLAPDIPEFDTIIVESQADQGAMGTKGIGEAPVVATAAAVVNAVSDATGVRFQKIPLTPEYVLSCMESETAVA
ncbi:MAG: xanthine dehydrogenase family protein molybdopterin-binding subunit [Nitrospinota bacterium]